MKPHRSFAVLPLLLACLGACSSARTWAELRTGQMPIGQVYDSVEFVATSDGFKPDPADCDRGLGIWQSRWRVRSQPLGHPGRSRLHAEIREPRRGDPPGWLVRYYVERQRVKDLNHADNPTEDDWSSDGQDGEREQLFGERLQRRLRPPAPAAR